MGLVVCLTGASYDERLQRSQDYYDSELQNSVVVDLVLGDNQKMGDDVVSKVRLYLVKPGSAKSTLTGPRPACSSAVQYSTTMTETSLFTSSSGLVCVRHTPKEHGASND